MTEVVSIFYTYGPSIYKNVLREKAKFVNSKLHHGIHCSQLLKMFIAFGGKSFQLGMLPDLDKVYQWNQRILDGSIQEHCIQLWEKLIQLTRQ